jgi:hypothetical protein
MLLSIVQWQRVHRVHSDLDAVTALKLGCSKHSAYMERPTPPSKRKPHFETRKCQGENKNLGHGSREDRSQEWLLANSSSSLTDRPKPVSLETVLRRRSYQNRRFVWDGRQPARTGALEQRNVRSWKTLPSSALNTLTGNTTLCVIVVCKMSQDSRVLRLRSHSSGEWLAVWGKRLWALARGQGQGQGQGQSITVLTGRLASAFREAEGVRNNPC